MQTPTETNGFRVPLAWRIFLLSAILVVLTVGLAVLVTKSRGEAIADAAISRSMVASSEVQGQLAERRLEEVKLKVQVIGQDPNVVKYVSDAQGGDLGLGGDNAADLSSLADLLRERQQDYHFDLGLLLNARADVLVRTDETEALQQNLSGDPFVMSALNPPQPIAGFWRQGAKLYQAAIFPMELDRHLIGFVMVGIEVNNDLAARIGKASGSDIAFLLPSADSAALVGSSLEAAAAEALVGRIKDPASAVSAAVRAGKPIEHLDLDFAGQRWIGELVPVDANGGPQLGAVLRLTSHDKAAGGFRQILNLVALVGLGALLFALPLSLLLSRASLAPLRQMAQAAKGAAAGNFQVHIGVDGNDELAELSRAFDSLLSDLREKSDMEGYVNNLSRFLPEPGQEAPVPSFVTQQIGATPESTPVPVAPAVRQLPIQRVARTLVGIEFRDLIKSFDSADVDLAIDRAAGRIEHLQEASTGMGGELLLSSGQRVLIGFDGEDRLVAALHLVEAALREYSHCAIGLADGEIVQGSLARAAPGTPVVAGTAAALVDRLLLEAPTGRALTSRAVGDAAKAFLAPSALKVAQGIASGKPFYALDVESMIGLPPPPVVEPSERQTTPTPQPSPAAILPTAPRVPTELAPGSRMGGRYEILSVLGAGGMGVVYKARDLELDDVVALKMLRGSALLDAEQLERLKSEIRLARKITHPNVLRTFDFGDYQGLPYISMEYVRGMTLRYLLAQAGRLPYSAGLRIARQLCAGLAAAHEVGVVHRDIKPENLILEQNGNVKLMDFGIARPVRRTQVGQTQPGMFVGTPAYSAPEQLAGEEVDQRADIYSSGVLLCEVFSGKLPFSGSNTMEIYLAQMQQQPVRPSTFWPDIPPRLEQIILKSIAVKREERYQKISDLAADLSQLRA